MNENTVDKISFGTKAALGCVVSQHSIMKGADGKEIIDSEGKKKRKLDFTIEITDVPDFKKVEAEGLDEAASIMLNWLNRNAKKHEGIKSVRNSIYSSQLAVLTRKALEQLNKRGKSKVTWMEVMDQMATSRTSSKALSEAQERLRLAEQQLADTKKAAFEKDVQKAVKLLQSKKLSLEDIAETFSEDVALAAAKALELLIAETDAELADSSVSDAENDDEANV